MAAEQSGFLPKTRARVEARSDLCREWASRQEQDSVTGVAIAAWRRYRDVDGPLESALLSLYILVAVLPAVLVMEEYLESNPRALANEMVTNYNLSNETGALLRSVFAHNASHHLGGALLAVAGALFFGLGFGRVLQLVHARSWQLMLPPRGVDQARYAIVLCGLYGMLLLFLLQLNHATGDLAWVRLAVLPGWVGLLTFFFVWAPRLLTHKLISRRALLPSAIITAVGLVALMLLSGWVMEFWVTLYSKDYGGLGIVMAIFFWLGFSSLIIVAAAALAPALHDRRELHRDLHPRFAPGIHRRPHRLPHPHRPHLHRHRRWHDDPPYRGD